MPAATESAQGAVELETTTEAATGTDATRAVTPAGLAAAAWLRSLFLSASSGATDAGKPILLDAAGKIASSMLAAGYIDHNQLLNLATADPHTQYILKSLLTTKGDILARDASGPQRLAGGAEGQVLAVSAAEPTGLKWIPPVTSGSGIPISTVDAKGDLIVGTADDTIARLPVGVNGQVLLANSSQATGLEWSYLLQDNIFINGGFDLWQRTTDDTGVTTTRKYVADRWAVTAGAGTLAHVQRSTTLRTGVRSKYSLQLDGAAGVTTVDIDQRIEASVAGLYKRQITFSIYIYNGSGADFAPKLLVSTPSAADNWTTSTIRNGSGSGEDLQNCADSTWTLVQWTADVSSYTNIDNGVSFRLRIPSGSLVAGDVVRLAEANLVPGGVATPFVARHLPVEEMLCFRYWQKSYMYNVPVATNGASGYRVMIAASTSQLFGSNVLHGRMRANPTCQIYSFTGTLSKCSTILGADVGTTVTISAAGDDILSGGADSGAGLSSGAIYLLHYTASAEL
jgi:hypothetical protein